MQMVKAMNEGKEWECQSKDYFEDFHQFCRVIVEGKSQD